MLLLLTGRMRVIPETVEVLPVGGVLLGVHLLYFPHLPIGYPLQVNMLVAPADQLTHASMDPLHFLRPG